MRLHAWQYIFLLTVVFACGYANAGAIAKRATSDEGSSESALTLLLDNIVGVVRNVPLLGNLIANFIESMRKVVKLFEIATNGALARILGGALPCTISLSGTNCSGLKTNGGFGQLLLDVIDDVPSLFMPSLFKYIIKLGIKLIIDPTVDVLFGGIEISSSGN